MTCKNLLLETEKRYDFKNSGIKFEAVYRCSIKERSERERLDLLGRLLQKGFENSLSGTGCPFVETETYTECPCFEEKNNPQLSRLKEPA
jgi:hypothetical protein